MKYLKKNPVKTWKDTRENTKDSSPRLMNYALRILLMLRKVEKRIIIILKISTLIIKEINLLKKIFINVREKTYDLLTGITIESFLDGSQTLAPASKNRQK